MKVILLAALATLWFLAGWSQTMVSGHIVEWGTTKPIVQAKVTAVHSRAESMSDSQGTFSVKADGTDTLLVEVADYRSAKVAVGGKSSLTIVLEELYPVFTIVDEMTRPVGGFPKFYEYIKSNFVHPGKREKHGRIFMEFVIDTSGLVMQDRTKVVHGAASDPPPAVHETYDPVIIRLINASPAWIPARQRGEKVRQRMVLPINF